MNKEEDITPTGSEIQQMCDPSIHWCRFCKYFLPKGMLLCETKSRYTTLAVDCCEKYREIDFFPTSCAEARNSETLCGQDGRAYQECEDRWRALSPELRGIEYIKRGRLPDGSVPRRPGPRPLPDGSVPGRPGSRPWYVRLLDLLCGTEANHD